MDERMQVIARVSAGEDEMTALFREYAVSAPDAISAWARPRLTTPTGARCRQCGGSRQSERGRAGPTS